MGKGGMKLRWCSTGRQHFRLEIQEAEGAVRADLWGANPFAPGNRDADPIPGEKPLTRNKIVCGSIADAEARAEEEITRQYGRPGPWSDEPLL